MKKITLTIMVALFAGLIVKAQDIPERRQEPFKPHERQGEHMKGEMRELKLTDDQKAKFKSQHEDFRKQMEELKKNDNITVKEWRSKMETLRKDNETKMQGILTSEQKEQMEKMKTQRMAMREVDDKARMEKMKVRLGLSDEQAEKMRKSHAEMGEKLKALREDKNLDPEKKKEQMKELMKAQKEKTKSILTEDQLKKLKEEKERHPHKGQVI